MLRVHVQNQAPSREAEPPGFILHDREGAALPGLYPEAKLRGSKVTQLRSKGIYVGVASQTSANQMSRRRPVIGALDGESEAGVRTMQTNSGPPQSLSRKAENKMTWKRSRRMCAHPRALPGSVGW